VRQPYLRVLGVEFAEAGTGRSVATFSAEEENAFNQMATDPAIFERLSNSVAPSIKGDYTDDIKRAIMALLLGGSRKLLADGARLRGDINVLMLGDPSTAKSQFLKFVEKVAPVGVYTSGKGSSAAVLTASVLKSPSGEFFLEGGAMVMADGGVVCIDEFDKMREEDRVAIHEAMEQQTISVAKAGITTILNSRCSVLAAANPVYGRYDDSKTATENIDLLPTILSRFDLIFIVRDTRNTERDLEIARHVVNVHRSFKEAVPGEAAGAGAGAGGAGVDIDIGTMKKFITFARNKCAPRLNAEAAALLAGKYADIRAAHAMRESGAQASKGENAEGRDSASVIPIRPFS
jgi:DNA replication licensing factor MCM5